MIFRKAGNTNTKREVTWVWGGGLSGYISTQ